MKKPTSKRTRRASSLSVLVQLATAVIVVGILYFAQDLLLPFAVAALLTFLLAPIVNALQRLRLPRIVAVAVTVLTVVGGIAAVGATVVTQLDDLSEKLPEYRDTVETKLAVLGGVMADLEQAFSAKPSADTPGGAKTRAPGAPRPVAVEVVASDPDPIEVVTTLVGPLLGPLGTMAIVFVLVLFLLIYLENLRDRFVSLLRGRDITRTTQAVTDVSRGISRYLLMTLIVNTTYGIPIGIGLALLGIPNALLWGLLATVLRFIPYLGPLLAAAMPILLSVAISPDWGVTIAVVSFILTLELISNNLVEPWLYGTRTGLSPLAIIVSAIFWTWLWGITGLLLAVPLTLTLVISGRYVPALHCLYVIFGDGPALDIATRFYQRLVVDDPDEASRIADAYLDRCALPELYDAVFIPAMRALRRDQADGRLTDDDSDALRDNITDLMDGLPALSDRKAQKRLKLAAAGATDTAPGDLACGAPDAFAGRPDDAATHRRPEKAPCVVYIPAGDETDALVGKLLTDLLEPDGVTVETLRPTGRLSDLVRVTGGVACDVVVVGGFPPGSLARLRKLVALTANTSGEHVRVVAGLWDAPSAVDEDTRHTRKSLLRVATKAKAPTVLCQVLRPVTRSHPGAAGILAEAGAHEVVHTLAAAVAAVHRALRPEESVPAAA